MHEDAWKSTKTRLKWQQIGSRIAQIVPIEICASIETMRHTDFFFALDRFAHSCKFSCVREGATRTLKCEAYSRVGVFLIIRAFAIQPRET